MKVCYRCEEQTRECKCLDKWIDNLKKYEVEDNELLKLIKKEAKCKNNQQLLSLLDRLSDQLRKWKRDQVYAASNRYVVKSGSSVIKTDLAPESEARLHDDKKADEDILENTTGAMVD